MLSLMLLGSVDRALRAVDIENCLPTGTLPLYVGPAEVQPTAITAFAVAMPSAVPSAFTLSFVAAKGSSNEVAFDITLQPTPEFPAALVGRNDQASFPKVEADPGKDRLEITLSLGDAQFTQPRERLRDMLLIVSLLQISGRKLAGAAARAHCRALRIVSRLRSASTRNPPPWRGLLSSSAPRAAQSPGAILRHRILMECSL